MLIADFMDPHDAAKISVEETFVGTPEGALEMPKLADVHHAVPHTHGISEGAMREAVEKAGLVNFGFQYAFTAFGPTDGAKQPFFIVSGEKL